MRSGLPKLFFVAAFVVNCIIWSHSRFGQVNSRTLYVTENQLAKRALFDLAAGNATYSFAVESDGKQCYPISLPREQQCTHVHEACLDAHTVLSIPYLRSYFCTKPSLQTGAVHGVSHLLGLDENVAGVTFLAFGNGSPDVFATFSAMRTNSGGLAIGELLGAAAFVTSCVVGSMCIIKPFKVGRVAFLRDVGFFTVAVILLLFVLWDSKIEAWEAAGLIMLYVFYVTVVVVGSWWERNQERKRVYETLIRDEYRDEDVLQVPYHDEEVYTDELSPSSTAASTLRVHHTPDPVRSQIPRLLAYKQTCLRVPILAHHLLILRSVICPHSP
ncbi:putative cation exchanger C3A12.06c [Grifola frondosa]|uniref:Putative cation exchanger C3A12.06c n=1 Tax=Grifola frondosa TaxID=5627 RepID=A0A1C7M6V5_GRIFR|nr:putative cation exchanger C3A12.06c [Grifola frondosa]